MIKSPSATLDLAVEKKYDGKAPKLSTNKWNSWERQVDIRKLEAIQRSYNKQSQAFASLAEEIPQTTLG